MCNTPFCSGIVGSFSAIPGWSVVYSGCERGSLPPAIPEGFSVSTHPVINIVEHVRRCSILNNVTLMTDPGPTAGYSPPTVKRVLTVLCSFSPPTVKRVLIVLDVLVQPCFLCRVSLTFLRGFCCCPTVKREEGRESRVQQ